MSHEMECMCLNCGISLYIPFDYLVYEELDGGDMKVIKDVFCTECGNVLTLIGKAGDEPFYRLG